MLMPSTPETDVDYKNVCFGSTADGGRRQPGRNAMFAGFDSCIDWPSAHDRRGGLIEDAQAIFTSVSTCVWLDAEPVVTSIV